MRSASVSRSWQATPRCWSASSIRPDRPEPDQSEIAKSGGTAETLMQFLSVLPLLRATLGDARVKDHVTIITEPGDKPLRKLAEVLALPVAHTGQVVPHLCLVPIARGALWCMLRGVCCVVVVVAGCVVCVRTTTRTTNATRAIK